VTAAIGALVMTTGVIAALALADAPMAVIASVALGALGLSLAADRIAARARGWRRPRFPLLSGPYLAVAGGGALTWMIGGAGMAVALPGDLAEAAGTVAAGGLLGTWCAVSVLTAARRAERSEPAERPGLTAAERAALDGEASLNDLLAETAAQAWRERKCRLWSSPRRRSSPSSASWRWP
jgi:hypothetical protein